MRALPGWSIAAALGFVLANSAFIALRWRYLFAAARYSTTARGLFPIFCVGAAANNVIPARGGDLLRIASARRAIPHPRIRDGRHSLRGAPARRSSTRDLDPPRRLDDRRDRPPAARRRGALGRYCGRACSCRAHRSPSRPGRAGRVAPDTRAARPLAREDRSRDGRLRARARRLPSATPPVASRVDVGGDLGGRSRHVHRCRRRLRHRSRRRRLLPPRGGREPRARGSLRPPPDLAVSTT